MVKFNTNEELKIKDAPLAFDRIILWMPRPQPGLIKARPFDLQDKPRW